MAGFVSEYAESDWLSDITLAHSFGLDGFALNVDESAAIPTQLSNAFSAAESFNSGLTDGTQFVLFVSFDFLHYSTSDPQSVADALTPILDSSAYLVVDGKKMVSSFEGDGMDWSSVSSAAGQDLYPVPYYSSGASNAGDANVDGLFSWYTWPGQDTNDVVYQNMTTDVDEGYITSLEAAGKYYMAPVSCPSSMRTPLASLTDTGFALV
jgi:glucan endo-1,3-alpha-glucosidase